MFPRFSWKFLLSRSDIPFLQPRKGCGYQMNGVCSLTVTLFSLTTTCFCLTLTCFRLTTTCFCLRMVFNQNFHSHFLLELQRNASTGEMHKAVILPIREYERLLEDLHDLSVVAERRDESPVSLAEMKQRKIMSKFELLLKSHRSKKTCASYPPTPWFLSAFTSSPSRS